MSVRTGPAALSAAEAGALITRIATSRDRQAFAVLFAYYFPRVKAYLLRAGASPDVAEELAQETMLRVWRKAESFDPERGRGVDLDLRHRPQSAHRPPARRAPWRQPRRRIRARSPTRRRRARRSRSCRNAARACVRRSGALSAEQARIIELFYFDEHPQSEIARMLGVPLGTVKSRIRLAVQRLRAELEDLGS